MQVIEVNIQGDGAWPDLQGRDVIEAPEGTPIRICTLDGGMQSGLPSVAFRIDLADGKTVFAQTSLRNLAAAVKIVQAKYPEFFQ